MSFRRFLAVAACCTAAALAAAADAPQKTPDPAAPPVLGLDHIPLAVRDLDAAAERYRQLGFTLKPGRPHANGIRNQHAKFPDGTELELITAAESRDALTATYVSHLRKGDGPAFVAFYAPDMGALARRLDEAGRRYRRAGALLTFHEDEGLRYLFFGPRNSSPTDRPEHFRHANGADALIGVWLAADDLSAEAQLLVDVGATIADRQIPLPGASRGRLLRLPQGEVVLLPIASQLVSGRRIVGATLRTRSVDDLRRVLARRSGTPIVPMETMGGTSVLLPPEVTHGIWLEFRAAR